MDVARQAHVPYHAFDFALHRTLADQDKVRLWAAPVDLLSGANKEVRAFLVFEAPDKANQGRVERDADGLAEGHAVSIRRKQVQVHAVVDEREAVGRDAHGQRLGIRFLAHGNQVRAGGAPDAQLVRRDIHAVDRRHHRDVGQVARQAGQDMRLGHVGVGDVNMVQPDDLGGQLDGPPARVVLDGGGVDGAA